MSGHQPPPWGRRMAALFVVLGGLAAAPAGAEHPDAAARDEALARAAAVEPYLEGSVPVTTLEMIKNVAIALHEDHRALEQELAALREELTRVAEEVRRRPAERRR